MLRGAASNYVGRFAGLVVWFFFTPFVLHHLGPAEYGLWVVIASVVGYGWVFNLGIGTDNLLHREGRRRYTAAIEIANLTNKVALYNFLSTFSGTHFLQPRTVVARVGLVF